jgi:hypothetical protein
MSDYSALSDPETSLSPTLSSRQLSQFVGNRLDLACGLAQPLGSGSRFCGVPAVLEFVLLGDAELASCLQLKDTAPGAPSGLCSKAATRASNCASFASF